MTDQTTDTAAMIAALQQQLAGMQQPGGMMQPAAPTITGVGVPVKIQTPDGGNVKINLMLPAETAATPQTLMMALQQLQAQGWPLDVWYPKPQGGGSWGGNNSGGGWNQGGGGYGGTRGGYRGRW